MKVLHNVSVQQISWVKSNKEILEPVLGIQNLYYPENLKDLKSLIEEIRSKHESFDIIGYSSNTLFLPSYQAQHVICTKKIDKWTETDGEIICDCGVPVSKLSKWAIGKGYVGFEGLTDLPGTVAAAVYGNCGCRGCSVNSIVRSFTLLDSNNEIKECTVDDLKLNYRSTALKRGELIGTILQVILYKNQGDAKELMAVAEKNHQIRKAQQPSGFNNLGTTINGGSHLTFKGKLFRILEHIIRLIPGKNNPRQSFPVLLRITGNSKFIPYVYYWNRYMFINKVSHDLFNDYYSFICTLYKDARLEIEIKK